MKHLLRLSPSTRAKAVQGAQRAPDGWIMELREAKRSDDQNAALWGLMGQIQKQRPTHMGVKMSPDKWKAVFMQALGEHREFLPTLDGDSMFPIGQRSSHLTKGQFSALLELALAWCAREGLVIQHFDGPPPHE